MLIQIIILFIYFELKNQDIFISKGVSFFLLICECMYLRRQQRGRKSEIEAVSENLGQINSCCQLPI